MMTTEKCLRGDGTDCVSDPDACAELGLCWPGRNDAQTRVETCAACGERFVNAESKDGHYIPWSADRSPGRCRDPWLMTNLDGSYTYKCDHHEPSDRLGWECIWSLNEPKAAS